MADFKRVAWINDRARAVWESRLRRIATAWTEVEWLSVPAGLRDCAIVSLAPGRFVERARAWAALGLSALPLSIHGRGPIAAATASRTGEPQQIDHFRVAVAAPENLAALTHALDHNDDTALAGLLGVPTCCSAHRRRHRTAAMDPTWFIAAGSRPHDPGDTCLDVDGPWQTNVLWRWLTICAMPHLPCSLDCEASRAIADRLIALGREAGYAEEMSWMREVLSWPVEWTALHGIAVISTPILKISARTDTTEQKFTVRRHGEAYPAEGATGLCFPYRRQTTFRSTAAKAFKIGMQHTLSARGA